MERKKTRKKGGVMGEFPNISKKEAKKAINTTLLYLRQFGFNNKNAVLFGNRAKEVEKFILDALPENVLIMQKEDEDG